ncbi:MAG: GNAT family N-acetyltransferase [Cyanobacteria bacterium J06597_1]
MTFIVESFDKRIHLRDSFDCGNDALNSYIQRQASQDLKRKIAALFVMTAESNSEVIAYYTLSMFSAGLTDLQPALAKRLPRYPKLPATLLGRLAVDRQHKGRGLGGYLLVDALKRALDVSSQVGTLAVVAEAIDENAVTFYRKYGFESFQSNPQKLYLSMKSIQALRQKVDF